MTEREKDVLRCYLEGATLKETGWILGMRPDSAKEHMKQVRLKLGVTSTSRYDLMNRCQELGLLRLEILF